MPVKPIVRKTETPFLKEASHFYWVNKSSAKMHDGQESQGA